MTKFTKRYIAYIKNNPQGYWFKAKAYGWGWVPAKWQGWLVLAIFLAFILYNAFLLPEDDTVLTDGTLLRFFAKLAFGILAVVVIACWKGEKPSWHWGLPDNENK